jgi:hypothetical protein
MQRGAELRTLRQGESDALCGVYAIINAFAICGVRQQSKKIYTTAIHSLIQSGREAEIIYGAGLDAEEQMLKACLSLHGANSLFMNRPFEGAAAETEDEFWSRLNVCFADEGAEAVIQGIRKPSDHWVAFTLSPRGEVKIFDSDPGQPRRQTLTAGRTIKALSRRNTDWKIEQAETLVVYRR